MVPAQSHKLNNAGSNPAPVTYFVDLDIEDPLDRIEEEDD